MQLVNVCYVLLTVTITTTCVYGENQRSLKTELSAERADRRISKGDALLMDSYHLEPYSQPKTFYRRVTRHRNKSPKSKYTKVKPKHRPSRHYRPTKKQRWPITKYKGTKGASKYGSPHKTRRLKPKYGVPKKPQKLVYGPPKKIPPLPQYLHEPSGFGEPTSEFIDDFQSLTPKRVEPPVDSYGAPLQAVNEHYPIRQNFFGENQYNNAFHMDQEIKLLQNIHQDVDVDNTYAHSEKHLTFAEPKPSSSNVDNNEDIGLHTYSDIYKHEHDFKEFPGKKKKLKPFADPADLYKHWKKHPIAEDQMLVGGQYAEPPARYVPKFQPSAPMLSSDDFAPVRSPSNDVPSATISPYVNYKNSNMAFSPQNLNDAFSISR